LSAANRRTRMPSERLRDSWCSLAPALLRVKGGFLHHHVRRSRVTGHLNLDGMAMRADRVRAPALGGADPCRNLTHSASGVLVITAAIWVREVNPSLVMMCSM
jgi:hypothetical protein